MFRFVCTAAFLLGCLGSVPRSHGADFELRDGDRVVLVGSTIIEREQTYGCWETMLTAQFPKRNVTVRNLGWSGDTVWGESRAGFGTPADGYRDLIEHVTALKPTVILVGYGSVEAFEGEAGMKRFDQGLRTLLDDLDKTKARIVMLAPMKRETFPPPLPDPAKYNHELWHYRDAIHGLCIDRHYAYVDLDRWLEPAEGAEQSTHWTDNGVHLTGVGYMMTAAGLENELTLPPAGWKVEVDASGKSEHLSGTEISEVATSPSRLEFTLLSKRLPFTAATRQPGQLGVLRISQLEPGRYKLSIDGTPIIKTTADEWAGGVGIDDPAELKQLDQLRRTIVDKNLLYFYRWRPQNQTYLFGFRKHEQGKNAAELAEFDPLIAAQESKIAELRVPKPHHYVLERVAEEKR